MVTDSVEPMETLGQRLNRQAKRLMSAHTPAFGWLRPMQELLDHLASLPGPAAGRFDRIEAGGSLIDFHDRIVPAPQTFDDHGETTTGRQTFDDGWRDDHGSPPAERRTSTGAPRDRARRRCDARTRRPGRRHGRTGTPGRRGDIRARRVLSARPVPPQRPARIRPGRPRSHARDRAVGTRGRMAAPHPQRTAR